MLNSLEYPLSAACLLSLWDLFSRRTKQSSPRDLGPGSQFDRYTIERHLKEGGMASVYAATDVKTGVKVALKVMHHSLFSNPELVTKFFQEGDTLERIKRRDPQAPVVTVYRHSREDNEPDGRPFLALEFVPGQDLGDILRAGRRFTVDESAEVILTLAHALQAAHQERVWHRDLSPGNVMIDTNSQGRILKVTLIDFGVARNEYLSPVTPDGSIVGKPPYMSPEQCANRPLDGRSDIYSLGTLFYTLLTGRPPFLSNRPLDVMRMHEQEPIPPVPPTVPDWARTVVPRMLQKDPRRRYQTVDELLTAIAELRSYDAPTSIYTRSRTADPEIQVRQRDHAREEKAASWTKDDEPLGAHENARPQHPIPSGQTQGATPPQKRDGATLATAKKPHRISIPIQLRRLGLPLLASAGIVAVVFSVLPTSPTSSVPGPWPKRGTVPDPSAGSSGAESILGQVDSSFYLALDIPRRSSRPDAWIGIRMEGLTDSTICLFFLTRDTCYFERRAHRHASATGNPQPLAAVVGTGSLSMAIHHIRGYAYLYLTGDNGITKEPLQTIAEGPIRLSIIQRGADHVTCAYELQTPLPTGQ